MTKLIKRIVMFVICTFPMMADSSWKSKPPSDAWENRDKIESLVKDNVPIGSSSEGVKAFFEKEGVKLTEFPRKQKSPYRMAGYIVVRRAWPEIIVTVAMDFSDDKKLEKIKVTESATGP